VPASEAEPLLFEQSAPGRIGYHLPPVDVPQALAPGDALPAAWLRQRPPALPEVSELQVVRHFTRLSRRNIGIDTSPYPLGSCTMKYNPKINDEAAGLPGFAGLHPYAPAELAQGALELLWGLEQGLCALTGMAGFSLQPAAGAHGELAGMLICAAYHRQRGDGARRRVVVPDSAHGTNPASAAMAGFDVVEIPSGPRGGLDLRALRAVADSRLGALMLTNPNTLGLFEEDVLEAAATVHAAGGLLYYDGANLNAIVGRARPADMGFDICHLNLHKTFSTPHGMGGPGAGPVGVRADLLPLLPGPRLRRADLPGEPRARLEWEAAGPRSIGRIRALHGNFGVLVRAYAYLLAYGGGLREVSGDAVLAANYLLELLRPVLPPKVERRCMHEFVADGRALASVGLRGLDLCKALLDRGFHAPTMYFPLIVEEALMFEPTETEPREAVEALAAAVLEIVAQAGREPERVRQAPTTTPVGRVDEATAARRPVLRWPG